MENNQDDSQINVNKQEDIEDIEDIGVTDPLKSKGKKLYVITALLVVLLFGGYASTKIFKKNNKANGKPTEVAFHDPKNDQGVNCTAKSDADYYRTDRSFVIDPNNSQNLFVGVEFKGAYQSTNGGTTWKQVLKDYKWKLIANDKIL